MSAVSRRTVLGAGVALGALAGPLGGLRDAVASAATRPARLSRAAFVPHLHQKFHLTGHGRHVTATLTAITDIQGAPHADEHGFALMLRAPRRRRLAQDVYELSRAGYGSVRVLVVPVGRGVVATHYQVIVNNVAGTARQGERRGQSVSG